MFLFQEPPFSLALLLLWPGLHHHPPFFCFLGTYLFLALGYLSVLWSPCVLCLDPLLWIRAAPPSHRVCPVSQPPSCHLLKRSRAGLLLSVHSLGPSAFPRRSDCCLWAACVPEPGPPQAPVPRFPLVREPVTPHRTRPPSVRPSGKVHRRARVPEAVSLLVSSNWSSPQPSLPCRSSQGLVTLGPREDPGKETWAGSRGLGRRPEGTHVPGPQEEPQLRKVGQS